MDKYNVADIVLAAGKPQRVVYKADRQAESTEDYMGNYSEM